MTCPCGSDSAPLTKRQIRALERLRDREIVICPCGHEIDPPRTAHDVRKIGAIGDKLAHKVCVTGGAKLCAALVNNPGAVLSRNCLRKPSMRNARGEAVCTWHR